MENVFCFKQTQLCNEQADGLASVIGYEPWPMRNIEGIKNAINDDNPVLVRLHPGSTYPCRNSMLNYKLDKEGHAILLVGYDDNEQSFDVIDPWNSLWGGEYGGKRKISYYDLIMTHVNASLGLRLIIAVPKKIVSTRVDSDGNACVDLQIGYYLPNGYIIDQTINSITNVHINMRYFDGEVEKIYDQELNGSWCVGQYLKTSIPAGKNISDDVDMQFDIAVTIKGNRPYPYKDTLHFKFTEKLKFSTSQEKYFGNNVLAKAE